MQPHNAHACQRYKLHAALLHRLQMLLVSPSQAMLLLMAALGPSRRCPDGLRHMS
jgi:hypothetical protein